MKILFDGMISANSVDCRFTREGDLVKIKVEKPVDKKMIIDPLIFSTFCGGESSDRITDMDLGEDGEAVVAGWTESGSFPATAGAYRTVLSGASDAFIAKYKIYENDKKLLWATYFGGSGDDAANGCAIGPEGNIYFAGNTQSDNMPVTSAMMPELNGKTDCFVAKISGSGDEIFYSTYFGSTKDDYVYALDVGMSKAVYFTGGTYSTDFPVQSPDDGTHNGLEDLFVTKLSESGNSVIFSTYMGTAGNEHGTSIKVDEALGSVLVGAETDNSRFPTKPNRFPYRGYDRYFNGGWDGVIIKLPKNGGEKQFSMFFGGNNDDRINDVAFAGPDLYMITGQTKSNLSKVDPTSQESEFNLSNDAYDPSYNGGWDGFIAYMEKVEFIKYSTYFGGSKDDVLLSLCFNPEVGTATAVGYTSSPDFPIISDPDNPRPRGKSVAIVEFNPQNSKIEYSSVISGKGEDAAVDIKVDDRGHRYIAGYTSSPDFPQEQPTSPQYGGGNSDGFILKTAKDEFEITSPNDGAEVCQGGLLKISWSIDNMPLESGYSLYYSTPDNTEYRLIAEDVEDSKYEWDVPVEFEGRDDYILRVTHKSGIFSEIKNIKVKEKPTITSFTHEPELMYICAGGSAQFSVEAVGHDPEYSWTHDGAGIKFSGTTLILENLEIEDSGFYAVHVTNECSAVPVSDSARLVVQPETKITEHPGNETVIEGGDVEFFVIATGADLTYQWKKDGEALSGEKESTLLIRNCSESDEGQYECDVVGKCGELTTEVATLTVEPNSASGDGILEAGENIDIQIINTDDNTLNLKINSVVAAKLRLRIYDNRGAITSEPQLIEIIEGISFREIPLPRLNSGAYYLVGIHQSDRIAVKFNIVR
jgi:hypothetical protein